MKKAITLIALLATVGFSSTGQPEDTVESFLDAINTGEGYRAVCYISDDALLHIAEIQQQYIAAGASASIGFALIGLDATPADLLRWDTVDFAAHLLTSNMLTDVLNGSETESDQAVGGNSASVEIVLEDILTGSDRSIGVPMVYEGGRWKMADIQGILLAIPL